jgi:hypothetical protein
MMLRRKPIIRILIYSLLILLFFNSCPFYLNRSFLDIHNRYALFTKIFIPNAGSSTSTTTSTSNATYSIGVTISGLIKSGLVLQNNSADDLTISSGATSFTFATKVTGAYSVTVQTQPIGLSCIISNGTGTATANVTDISISCASDGSSWTQRTLPSASAWRSVTYGNGIFVAVAEGPSTIAATSP